VLAEVEKLTDRLVDPTLFTLAAQRSSRGPQSGCARISAAGRTAVESF